MAGPLYSNQPLINVATEVRFQGDLRVEAVRAKYQRKVRSSYPNLLVPEAKHGVAPALQPYRFEKDDDAGGIQLAVNSFSYYSRKYPGHESFLSDTKKLLSDFLGLIGSLSVSRIGWRYINAIPFAREQNMVPLHRFFHHIFGMSITQNHLFKAVNFSGTLPINDVELNMQLKSATSKDTPEEESLVLDIDVFKMYEMEDMKAPSILEEISNMHDEAYSVFEGLITESYRAHLRGDVDG